MLRQKLLIKHYTVLLFMLLALYRSGQMSSAYAAGRVSPQCYIYIKAGFSPPGSLIYRFLVFFFFLYEHVWVSLMLLYILHEGEKEIEFL